MSDARAEKRRARRAAGVQGTHEAVALILGKPVAALLREEHREAGYPGTQAEFAAELLLRMLVLVRSTRLAKTEPKLVEAATPVQTVKVLGRWW